MIPTAVNFQEPNKFYRLTAVRTNSKCLGMARNRPRLKSVPHFPIDESALEQNLNSQILPSGYLKHGKRWAKSSMNGDHWGVDGHGLLQVRQGHFGRRWILQDGVWVVSEDWKPVDLCLG